MPILLPVQEVRQIVLERGSRQLSRPLAISFPGGIVAGRLAARRGAQAGSSGGGDPQADNASRSGRSCRNSRRKYWVEI